MTETERLNELMNSGYEVRFLPVKVADFRAGMEGETLILEGRAILYNEVTKIWDDEEEEFLPASGTETIAQDDIRAVWNHNNDIVLGRKSAGTLIISEDESGVPVKIICPDSPEGRSKYESVRRGDVIQMSFAFRSLDETWSKRVENDRHIYKRTVKKYRLFEVSPVTFPAYENTTIQARCKQMAERNRPKPEASGEDSTAVLEVLRDAQINITAMRGEI